MTQSLIFIASVFGTSVLSGIFGMAGGLVLMGVLAAMLPLPSALASQGFAQLIANSTRFLNLLKDVDWKSTRFYLLGVGLAAAIFWSVSFTPDVALFYLVLGAIPLLSLFPFSPKFDFQKPSHSFVSGLINTAAHLTAGVSGPLLDLFFINTKMTRFQVVATKSFTQAIGHALKVGYFASATALLAQNPVWITGGVVASAITGTLVGAVILHRLNDAKFRIYQRRLFLVLGVVYFGRGLWLLLV